MVLALWRIARSASQEAVEPIQMWRVNGKLSNTKFADPNIGALSDADLSKYIMDDSARSKELDEKLQKLTAALSVAVTLGGFVGQTMLSDIPESWLRTTTVFLFLIAEFYLVIGVLVGLDGIRPRPRYGYGPAFLRIMAKGGDAKRKELISAANGSLRDNIMRANQASGAATAIRNGVLIFVLAVVLGLFAVEFAPPSASPNHSGASNQKTRNLGTIWILYPHFGSLQPAKVAVP